MISMKNSNGSNEYEFKYEDQKMQKAKEQLNKHGKGNECDRKRSWLDKHRQTNLKPNMK